MLPEVQYQWDHPMLLDREGNPGINFVKIYETFGISEFDNTIFRFFIAEKDDIEKERLNIEEGDVVVFSSFGNYFKYDYIIKGGGKNLSIQNGVYVGQKSSQFEIFLQQIYEFQAALEFFMNYTQTSGSYSASDYDLSAALGNNISVNVQAPYPPDTLHKVDIKDSRYIKRPLSSFMFSFKYYRAHPTTITDFNFISTSFGVDYTLAEPPTISSIIYA
ncbi:hypothetical protein ACJVDH_13095 [Pedobacter sp. AW1-32]|uniref:hypothetical protein n=1 Tax=Pedobacter sp. AW1-32 TaxID=3383026 RepID=UPI003FEF9394